MIIYRICYYPYYSGFRCSFAPSTCILKSVEQLYKEVLLVVYLNLPAPLLALSIHTPYSWRDRPKANPTHRDHFFLPERRLFFLLWTNSFTGISCHWWTNWCLLCSSDINAVPCKQHSAVLPIAEEMPRIGTPSSWYKQLTAINSCCTFHFLQELCWISPSVIPNKPKPKNNNWHNWNDA